MILFRKIIVLIFFFIATSGYTAVCKVEDTDLSGHYSGGCRSGLAHGRGSAVGRDKYTGEFRDGKLNGRGVYSWFNGHRYEGEFIDGRRNGKGVYSWPNGARYEGIFRDGKRNGFGIMKTPRNSFVPEHRSSLGKWENDQFIEQGIFEGGAFILQCPSEKACAELQASSGAAKGFRFEEPSGSRYTERLDPRVGVVVVDNERRLEWTKCFAGMESNGVGEPCTGKPQLLSHTRAVEFAEKLGWSLPPLAEFYLYEKNSYGDQIRLLLRDNGNRVWSSTGVSDTPNRKWAFIRVERSGGIYGSTSYTEATYHIDEQLPVMLIRGMRR